MVHVGESKCGSLPPSRGSLWNHRVLCTVLTRTDHTTHSNYARYKMYNTAACDDFSRSPESESFKVSACSFVSVCMASFCISMGYWLRISALKLAPVAGENRLISWINLPTTNLLHSTHVGIITRCTVCMLYENIHVLSPPQDCKLSSTYQ